MTIKIYKKKIPRPIDHRTLGTLIFLYKTGNLTIFVMKTRRLIVLRPNLTIGLPFHVFFFKSKMLSEKKHKSSEKNHPTLLYSLTRKRTPSSSAIFLQASTSIPGMPTMETITSGILSLAFLMKEIRDG